VDGALRARLIELNPDSASWPCDSSGASKVTVKAVSGGVKPISGDHGRVVDDRGFTYRAYLQPNELQDLADSLIKILDLQAKHGVKIRFNLSVEATSDASWHLTADAKVRTNGKCQQNDRTLRSLLKYLWCTSCDIGF
jgi:hypothetical protein